MAGHITLDIHGIVLFVVVDEALLRAADAVELLVLLEGLAVLLQEVLLAEQTLPTVSLDRLCMRLLKAHEHLDALRLGRVDEFIFTSPHALCAGST